MSKIMEEDMNHKIIDIFIKDYLPRKSYYRHSDIDIFVNITITELLNYNELLSEAIKYYIQDNFGNNYKYYDEIIVQKNSALTSLNKETKGNDSNDKTEKKNSILSFEFPEFEIYFVAKLYIDGMERKPECQTKLLFNSKNINQFISMRFKYKDLTTDSYISLELYSMQIIEKNLLAKTKIYLFDQKMNLNQGRHIFKLIKQNNDTIPDRDENYNNDDYDDEQLELDDVGKEIDLLINKYYGDELSPKNNENYSTKGELTLDDYFYNSSKKTMELKSNNMKYFEKTLNELLTRTNNSYVVIKFPSFRHSVIYEENISEDYKPLFKP